MKEHLDDAKSKSKDSHMWKHWVNHHGGGWKFPCATMPRTVGIASPPRRSERSGVGTRPQVKRESAAQGISPAMMTQVKMRVRAQRSCAHPPVCLTRGGSNTPGESCAFLCEPIPLGTAWQF